MTTKTKDFLRNLAAAATYTVVLLATFAALVATFTFIGDAVTAIETFRMFT